MKVINKGGTLVYGNEKGETVFLRTGETADVADEVYAEHRDKLKKVKELSVEEVEQAGEPEVQTTQQRKALSRAPAKQRGSHKKEE